MHFKLEWALGENWHNYKINWSNNAIEFYVDNILQHCEVELVPSAQTPMAFHNWVDNAVFDFQNGIARHITFEVTKPRSNLMKSFKVQPLSPGYVPACS